jgi:hypothetical protein
MIQIPSNSPCRDYCRSGSVSWEVSASADLVKEKPSSKGGGLLSKLAVGPSAGVGLIEDKQELYLYSIPSDEEGEFTFVLPPRRPLCLYVRRADDMSARCTVLQFSTSDRFHSPFFGLYDFSMMASVRPCSSPSSPVYFQADSSYQTQLLPPEGFDRRRSLLHQFHPSLRSSRRHNLRHPCLRPPNRPHLRSAGPPSRRIRSSTDGRVGRVEVGLGSAWVCGEGEEGGEEGRRSTAGHKDSWWEGRGDGREELELGEDWEAGESSCACAKQVFQSLS